MLFSWALAAMRRRLHFHRFLLLLLLLLPFRHAKRSGGKVRRPLPSLVLGNGELLCIVFLLFTLLFVTLVTLVSPVFLPK